MSPQPNDSLVLFQLFKKAHQLITVTHKQPAGPWAFWPGWTGQEAWRCLRHINGGTTHKKSIISLQSFYAYLMVNVEYTPICDTLIVYWLIHIKTSAHVHETLIRRIISVTAWGIRAQSRLPRCRCHQQQWTHFWLPMNDPELFANNLWPSVLSK